MVVDTQCHWFSPTLLDAHIDIDVYPRVRRDGDGYAFEVAPGRYAPWGPSFTDLELQLEMFAGPPASMRSSPARHRSVTSTA
jgi:hypothetical protein